ATPRGPVGPRAPLAPRWPRSGRSPGTQRPRIGTTNSRVPACTQTLIVLPVAASLLPNTTAPSAAHSSVSPPALLPRARMILGRQRTTHMETNRHTGPGSEASGHGAGRSRDAAPIRQRAVEVTGTLRGTGQ